MELSQVFERTVLMFVLKVALEHKVKALISLLSPTYTLLSVIH